MTQSIASQTRTQRETCIDCPKFRNFYDERSRGWCSAFDKVTRTHHPLTLTCNATIAIQSKVQSRQTVMVELITHELDINEQHPMPKDSQTIEIGVPEVSRQAVEQVISAQKEFSGYYVARFWEPYEEDEF